MIQNHIRDAIAAMPPGVDPQLSVQTKGLYAPLVARVGEGISADLDLAYGDHSRQRLDVYAKAGAAHDAILIYVPGGGFTGGDKRSDGSFFANVGRYAARQGVLGITANYRLSPEFTWPSAARDIAAVVAWAKSNAGRYRANANRIAVFGHSAGGSHVATFLFDPDVRGGEQVAGGILVSGSSYVLRKGELRGNALDYFGAQDALYEQRSAVNHVAGSQVPVLLACAEHDPGFLVTPTLELALALTRRDGRAPPLRVLEGHNHFSPPCSLGTDDDELGGAILRFIKGLA